MNRFLIGLAACALLVFVTACQQVREAGDNDLGNVTGVVAAFVGDRASLETVVGIDGEHMQSTDTAGRFALTAAPGRHFVAVQAVATDGTLYAAHVPVAVRSAETSDVGLITLRPAAAISGTVRLDGQVDAKGVTIYLEGTRYAAASAPDGSYQLTGIPPGEWTVRFIKPGFGAVEIAGVTVAERESRVLEAVYLGADPQALKENTRLTLSIVDGTTGMPIAGAVASSAGVFAVSAHDGLAEGLLEPGHHDVLVTAAGYRDGALALEAKAGLSVTEMLRLYGNDIKTGGIAGRLLSAGALLPIRGFVTVTPGGRQTLTDEAGAFQLPALAAGTYDLSFAANGFQPLTYTVAITAGTHWDLGDVLLVPTQAFDTTPPETVLLAQPPAFTNTSSALIAFEGTDDVGVDYFECRLDAGPWQFCMSPHTVRVVASGPHRAQVRAVDFAGNLDLSPSAATWEASIEPVVDLQPPSTTLLSWPAQTTTDTAAAFSFEATDDVAVDHVECRMDIGLWSPCTSPVAYADLTVGEHRFDARAVDTYGNVELSLATLEWRVTLPETPAPDADPSFSDTTPVFGTAMPATVAVGGGHACAISTDGKLACWGRNDFGQVGAGYRSAPMGVTRVAFAFPVTRVALGATHSCVVSNANQLYCWGGNANGQLGDGTTSDRLSPVAVTGIANAVTVAAGLDTTCAVGGASKRLYCWGLNHYGQVGDNSTASRFWPNLVTTITNVVKPMTSGMHTCAKVSNGNVYCWGNNAYGQVGDGTTVNKKLPVQVLTGAYDLAVGRYHTCASLVAASTRCWGQNAYYQLGDLTTTNRSSPTNVVITPVMNVPILAGDAHSCMLYNSKTHCWGNNASGQLGYGDFTQSSNLRMNALTFAAFRQAAISGSRACAILVAHGVYCWGDASSGLFGDGVATNAAVPQPVLRLGTPLLKQIALGRRHTCGVSTLGATSCWGTNSSGELGYGATGGESGLPMAANLTDARFVQAGQGFSCALTGNARLACWGSNTYGILGTGAFGGSVPNPTEITYPLDVSSFATSAMAHHVCLVTSIGAVMCWGRNDDGQIGDGSQENRSSPNPVYGLISGVRKVVVGGSHTCALIGDSVWCWGGNGVGQAGQNPAISNIYVPSIVAGLLEPISDISAGGNSTCVVFRTGKVACWGYLTYTKQSSTPTNIDGLTDVVSISVGSTHACAVTKQGAGYCFGYNNTYGAFGNGMTGTYTSLHLSAIAGLPFGVSELVAGEIHTCAITFAGGALCWGQATASNAPALGMDDGYRLIPDWVEKLEP